MYIHTKCKCIFLVALAVALGGIGLTNSSHRVSAKSFAANGPTITRVPLKNEVVECWPLDVVVLMDESLSMSQEGGNDPDGYRFLATEELLNLLISNRRAQCDEAVHRLGVIYFTNVVTKAVPLELIDIPITGERDNWEKYDDITQAIASGMPHKYKNGTDPALAFKAADELLTQAVDLPAPSGYGPRREIVILLTDGNPAGVGGLEKYMRTLTKDLNEAAWSRRSIWIVALNANGGP